MIALAVGWAWNQAFKSVVIEIVVVWFGIPVDETDYGRNFLISLVYMNVMIYSIVKITANFRHKHKSLDADGDGYVDEANPNSMPPEP